MTSVEGSRADGDTYWAAVGNEYSFDKNRGVFKLEGELRWLNYVYDKTAGAYQNLYLLIRNSASQTATPESGTILEYTGWDNDDLWYLKPRTATQGRVPYTITVTPSGTWDGSANRSFVEHGYQAVYLSNGVSQGKASAASAGSYPQNSANAAGTVWYGYLGSDSIDPLGLSCSAQELRPGDTLTVSVEAATPAFGGEIYYQYSYRVNGGSWVNLGVKTTSASKILTVPANAESIQVRVLTSDGWGFTSADYVQGPVLKVVKMAAYAGVSGKARALGKLYVGVNGKAREITAAYVGVGGKARKIL
ncbi:hypothetical protein [Acutalibacter intestini]|uniref:hypothetical protein n=1 Tax=Acutalibacter intestini TaxID=3093659 RepID=UPI002AC96DD4|nr:hypothetical protein [Acutalibacter sp. M00204]